MAHVRSSRALKPDGLGGKEQRWRWRGGWGNWETISRLIYWLKEIHQSPTACASTLYAAVRRWDSQCNKWCVKNSKDAEEMSSGATDTYREWIMSQHLASTWAAYTLRSISPMYYLPNGPWQSSFPWVVSQAPNIFPSDKTEHCCCFKTCFTSTYTCFCLSPLPLFIIHLCFSREKVANGNSLRNILLCFFHKVQVLIYR